MAITNITQTEERILKSILLLRSKLNKKKLSVTLVAKEADISRNAIYKYYPDLIPAISEGKDNDKFLLISREDILEIDAVKTKKLINDQSKKELHDLKAKFEKETEQFRHQVLGEYMQNLLISDNSKLIEREMLSMQAQLLERIRENKKLRLDKSKLAADVSSLESEVESFKALGGKKVIRKLFLPDYRSAKEAYEVTGKFSDWLSAKKTVTKLTLLQAIDYSNDSDAVILVQTKYDVNPEFLMNEYLVPDGKYTFINLNIPTATERKRIVNEIKEKTGIPVKSISSQTSIATTKWYRQTHKPHVPAEEIEYLDKHWQTPLISEGYKSIVILDIDSTDDLF